MSTLGTTTERGYGHEHRKLRAQLLPLAYGQPCPRCGQEMRQDQALDLDHTDDRAGYLGITHQTCNRRAGVAKTNSRPTTRGLARLPRRRKCVICGTTYRASSRDQQACGRACGVELQRRNRPAKAVKPARTYPVKACPVCKVDYSASTRYCGSDCLWEANRRRARDRYRARVGLPVDPEQPTSVWR